MPNPSSIFCSQILWYLGSRTKIISWQFSQNHGWIEIVYWEILLNWSQDYFLVWKFKTVYCYALILCQKFKQNTRPGTAWQTFFLATMIKIPSSYLLHVLCLTFCVISNAISWHFCCCSSNKTIYLWILFNVIILIVQSYCVIFCHTLSLLIIKSQSGYFSYTMQLWSNLYFNQFTWSIIF